MKKIAALVMAALLISTPVVAQTGPETPEPGAVIIVVGYYDGVDLVPYGNVIVPPIACDPTPQ